jgi:hypothetical protein
MEISRYLRQHARTIAGKSQLFINSYAKALEVCLVGLTACQFTCKMVWTTCVEILVQGEWSALSILDLSCKGVLNLCFRFLPFFQLFFVPWNRYENKLSHRLC